MVLKSARPRTRYPELTLTVSSILLQKKMDSAKGMFHFPYALSIVIITQLFSLEKLQTVTVGNYG